MCKQRSIKQKKSAHMLAQFLKNEIYLNKNYLDKPTWGYAFTALFHYSLDTSKPELPALKNALELLSKQNIKEKNFSWEFVIFACAIMSQDKYISNFIPLNFKKYKEKGTRMFNWFLLRCHNKLLLKKTKKYTLIKLKIALFLYQRKDGLILDEFKTRSLHYHAFCLFILAHIIKRHNIPWLKKSFRRGIKYTLQYILKDGTSLYIGRGQEQIFGYGALLYALEFYNRHFTPISANILDSVTNKIIYHQRTDGSFPLVLRSICPEAGHLSFNNDKPDGWHGYNTLSDYLPFLGYCLSEASKLE